MAQDELPEGFTVDETDMDPQSAIASQGLKKIAQAAYQTQPMQNIISGQGVKDYYNTAVAAAHGNQDAQQRLAERSLGTAIGSLKPITVTPEGSVIKTLDIAPQSTTGEIRWEKGSEPSVGKVTWEDEPGIAPSKGKVIWQKMADGGEVGLPAGFTLDTETPPQVDSQPQNQQPSDELPSGFQLDEEKYGTPLEEAKTFEEAVGRGIAGPIFTGAELGLGVKPEDIRGRMEASPWLAGAGEVTGLTLPAIVSGGTSLAAKTALESLSLPGLLGKAGEAAAEVAGKVMPETLAGRMGVSAAKGTVENALLAGSDEASRMLLQDPNQSAETAVISLGGASILGAIVGGAAPGVPALWKSAFGDKLGKVAADFQGETKFQLAHPDHVEALTNELQELHGSVTEPASEVYGASGLKAQALEKTMPELSDAMIQQGNTLVDSGNKVLAELGDDPNARFLNNHLMKLKSGMQSPNPLERFNATQAFKQALQEDAEYGAGIAPLAERPYRSAAKDLAFEARNALEDVGVWGDAAKLQQGTNSAFKAYLPNLQKFEKTFMTKVADPDTGKIFMQVNPGKVATYLNQVGKPSAEIKQEFLENFLKASDRYKGEIGKLYDKLELDNPIRQTSTAVINHSLETPTLGSKIGRAFFSKALSDAGATTLASGVGAGLGHMVGVSKEIGAIIGAGALGPFFRSALPGIAKAFVSKGEHSGLAAKSAIDYGVAVAKGWDLMGKAAKNVFRVESPVLAANMLPDDKDRMKMAKAIDQMGQNPQQAYQNDPYLEHYLPEHSNAMTMMAARNANLINGMRVSTAKKAPLDSNPVVSLPQKAALNQAVDIVHQPLVALERLKKGTLTAKDVITLSHAYPSLYRSMCQKLTEEMTNHISKGGVVPYKTRIGLSVFLGQPLDSSMSPSSIVAAQPMATQQQPQMPASRGRSQAGVKSSPALQKMPLMYQTPGQARAAGKVKE
jgi:hypothetical protein